MDDRLEALTVEIEQLREILADLRAPTQEILIDCDLIASYSDQSDSTTKVGTLNTDQGLFRIRQSIVGFQTPGWWTSFTVWPEQGVDVPAE